MMFLDRMTKEHIVMTDFENTKLGALDFKGH